MKNELGIKCKTPKTSDALHSTYTDQKGTPKLIPPSHFLQMKNIRYFQLKQVFLPAYRKLDC